MLAILVRHKRGYRWIDHFFTIRVLGFFYPVLKRFRVRHMPKFARKQAMGIDTVFK